MKMIFVGAFSPNSTNIWQAKGFENQGIDVVRYSYRERLNDLENVIERDNEIVDLCKEENPDFILFSKCNYMSPVVNKLCQEVCKTVMWYMDDIHNVDSEFLQKLPFSDFVFTACDGCIDLFKEYSDNVHRLHGGFDSEIHKPINAFKIRDVAFIGDLRPKRQVFKQYVDFEVVSGVYGIEHSVFVSGTKINLNFTEGRGTSNRLLKIMAAGGFALTQPYLGIKEDFVIGEHLDVFVTVDGLRSKINYYLNHDYERQLIARAGARKVKEYDNNNFAQRIIKEVYSAK